MSQAKIGVAPANKGKKGLISDETRAKMSVAGKGRIPWNKGKTDIISDETRKKMSESSRRRNHDHLKRSVLKYDLEWNFIEEFDSVLDAAKSVGSNYTDSVSRVCLGKKEKFKGYYWKYKDSSSTIERTGETQESSRVGLSDSKLKESSEQKTED